VDGNRGKELTSKLVEVAVIQILLLLVITVCK
jgi:hypothetical protein